MQSTDGDLAILAEGLSKRYGPTEALREVDLQVAAGSVCGLLGPNGAGKTTAVRILSTLLQPDAGSARVAGYDVVRQAGQVRQRIGLTGQYAALDELLTGRANLEMIGRLHHLSGPEARRRAGDLLERFRLIDAAGHLVKTYSGGMRRRLDLAASLIGAPAVLFLDEPTTGLDPSSRNHMWEVIGDLVTGGTTVLLTTQYLEEADRLADRIVVVDHGQVIAAGSSLELKAKVGGERIDLTTRGRADLPLARAAIRRALGIDPHLEAAGNRLTASVQDGPSALTAVARELGSAGVLIEDIALRRPTLDDVFLRLTGQTTEEFTKKEVA